MSRCYRDPCYSRARLPRPLLVDHCGSRGPRWTTWAIEPERGTAEHQVEADVGEFGAGAERGAAEHQVEADVGELGAVA